MVVLDEQKSDELRRKYIQTFVDYTSKFYIENIQRTKKCVDGWCYNGYLWDCMVNPRVVSENEADQAIKDKKDIYIMWDIHSCEKIFIPNYWKYPKSRVLFVNKWSDTVVADLPEDLYLFDDTFSWSVIYTHETDLKNYRYCIYLDKGKNIPDKR